MTLQKISFEYDIPDGYRFLRFGAPKKSELYLKANGRIYDADFDYTEEWIILERIPLLNDEPVENQNRRKHADLIHAWAEGAEIQFQREDGTWEDVQSNNPVWHASDTYRIKPKTKTVRFRLWMTVFDDIVAYVYGANTTTPSVLESLNTFKQWLGDWQEVEIEEC